jgi:hypothetical protein
MTVTPEKLTGALVRQLREHYKLGRGEFAKLCGWPTQTRVSNIEFKDSWKEGNRETVAAVLNQLEVNPPSGGRRARQVGQPKITKRESAEERVDRLEANLHKSGKLIREVNVPDETVIPDFDDEEGFRFHEGEIQLDDKIHLETQGKLAVNPPEGWFVFGTHAAFDVPVGMLEFSTEKDEDGDPLWERPAPLKEQQPNIPPPLIGGVGLPIVEAPRIPDHVRDISPFRTDVKLVSNSEIETMRRCKRKWWFAWYRKLGMQDDVMGARAIGRRVHRALAGYYVPEGETPVDPRDGLERAIVEDWTLVSQRMTDENVLAELAGRFQDACSLERAMVEGYMEWLAETGADQNLRVVASETPLAATLETVVDGEKREFQAIGLFDARVTRSLDGVRMLIDHKTVPDLTGPTKTLHMNVQIKHYHMLEWLNTAEGEARCDGALYNMLRKVKRTARANPPFYGRVEVRHNPYELEAYKRNLLAATRDIMIMEDALNAGADPQDVAYPSPRDTCSWDCDYFAVCPMFDDGSRAEDMLTGLYHEVDPLARYDHLETPS